MLEQGLTHQPKHVCESLEVTNTHSDTYKLQRLVTLVHQTAFFHLVFYNFSFHPPLSELLLTPTPLLFCQGSQGSHGKSDSEAKGRDKFPPSVPQAEERRKRQLRSEPQGAPPESRRRLGELRHTEESVSVSSDLASESEAEEEEEDEEADWAQGGDADRMKCEEGGGGKQTRGPDTRGRGERASRVHNSRAVIQQLKSVVATPTSTPASGSPSIKTEHEVLATGGRWGATSQTPASHAHTPSGSLNGENSPTTPVPDSSSSSEAPPKGFFNPPSPALSPAMSVSSPLPRDERSAAVAASGVASRNGGSAVGGPDFELLQRLAAGGAAGRVLFHPLALGPQGPQSLYAPSTIRYAPPELPPSSHHHHHHPRS